MRKLRFREKAIYPGSYRSNQVCWIPAPSSSHCTVTWEVLHGAPWLALGELPSGPQARPLLRLGRHLTHPPERGSSLTPSTGAPHLFPPGNPRLPLIRSRAKTAASRAPEASRAFSLQPSRSIHARPVPSSLHPAPGFRCISLSAAWGSNTSQQAL